MSLRLLHRPPKMAADLCRIVCCGLLLVAGTATSRLDAQAPGAKGGVFPDRFLEGTGDFDLALTLQGDLRGNYGPCG